VGGPLLHLLGCRQGGHGRGDAIESAGDLRRVLALEVGRGGLPLRSLDLLPLAIDVPGSGRPSIAEDVRMTADDLPADPFLNVRGSKTPASAASWA